MFLSSPSTEAQSTYSSTKSAEKKINLLCNVYHCLRTNNLFKPHNTFARLAHSYHHHASKYWKNKRFNKTAYKHNCFFNSVQTTRTHKRKPTYKNHFILTQQSVPSHIACTPNDISFIWASSNHVKALKINFNSLGGQNILCFSQPSLLWCWSAGQCFPRRKTEDNILCSTTSYKIFSALFMKLDQPYQINITRHC